jgi:hypothetical protein
MKRLGSRTRIKSISITAWRRFARYASGAVLTNVFLPQEIFIHSIDHYFIGH